MIAVVTQVLKEGCEIDRGQRRAFVNKITELWIQSNTTAIQWRYSAEPKANDKTQCRHNNSFHLHKPSLKLTNSKYMSTYTTTLLYCYVR